MSTDAEWKPAYLRPKILKKKDYPHDPLRDIYEHYRYYPLHHWKTEGERREWRIIESLYGEKGDS